MLYSKTEVVLTCTHNICFEQKNENSQKNSNGILIFKAMKTTGYYKRRVLHVGSLLILFSDKTIVCCAGISLIKISDKIR